MLFIAEPEAQARVREALRHLIHVPVEINSEGSRIMVYEPDDFIAPG